MTGPGAATGHGHAPPTADRVTRLGAGWLRDGRATALGRTLEVPVEAEDGPPDEANRPDARLVTPAAPLVLRSTWRWELP